MTLSPPGEPAALAHVSGGPDSPVSGLVAFFPHELGTLVTAQIHGLPYEDAPCSARIFGFHIHDGSSCTPPDFQDAGGHLNPADCPHPYHAGDLPPLFGCRGEARMSVLTDRFSIPETMLSLCRSRSFTIPRLSQADPAVDTSSTTAKTSQLAAMLQS